MNYRLEIIGFNIESCLNAQAAGADRIELCGSPGEGGTTPSYSLIREARRLLKIPLYVMIRPRGGDFLYSDIEFDMMTEDVKVCKNLGCDGVVTGILDENGHVDTARCTHLTGIAYPLGATFHRAFDRTADYKKSLADVIQSGFERILTSGLKPSCTEGLDTLVELVELAGDNIIIMPGSGVRTSNIAEIVKTTGASEVHSSASASRHTRMKYQNPEMNESLEYVTADADVVGEMKKILNKITVAGA